MSYPGITRWRGRVYTWTVLAVLLALVIGHWAIPTRADSPGYALQFNGSTNYVSLGDTGNLMGTNNWISSMTISVWLRVTGQTPPTTFPPTGELIAGTDTPRLFGINRAVYNGSDKIWLWNADSNGVDILGVTVTPGVWTHIAMVHSNGMLYAYKNGVLVSSIPSGNTYVPDFNTGDGKLYLGGSGRTDQTLYFEGELDEGQFWNTALSEATIAAWWNREVTVDHPNWANLAAYYQMSDGVGTVLSDNSGHGRTGTLKGGMTDANWVPSGALGGALPTPTATFTPTFTPQPPSPTPTDTPTLPADTPTPTVTPALVTDTPTFTAEPPTPTPTDTPPVLITDTPTFTPEPPTPTPTFTSAPPTATPTFTLVPPTPTPTFTPAPPTATPTFTPLPPTPTPTFTPAPPTATPTFTPLPSTPTPTFTPVPPSATPTFTPLPPTPTPTSTVAAGGFALEFDGNNDFVLLNETALIMAPGWQYTKSVSLWVRPTGPSPVCSHSDVATCDNIFGDRPRWWGIARGVISGQDRIWIFNADGSSGSYVDKIGVTYNPDEWVHIAMVHSNGILRVYKNGVEVGSVASGMTLQPTTGAHPILHLGGIISNATNNWTFQGRLDEVQIWNTARTASEIQQYMYQPLIGSESGLAAYYRMSDGAGTILTDDSIYNWNGTLYDGNSSVPPDGSPPKWVVPGIF